MSKQLYRINFQAIKQTLKRGVVICCLASTLAVGMVVVNDVQPVAAAAVSATTVRQDRRPDRERAVVTSGSSSGSSARPRIVRH